MARVRQPWQDRIPKTDRPTTGRVGAELDLHAGNDKVSHTKSPQFIQEWGLVKGI